MSRRVERAIEHPYHADAAAPIGEAEMDRRGFMQRGGLAAVGAAIAPAAGAGVLASAVQAQDATYVTPFIGIVNDDGSNPVIGASALFVSWRHDPHCDHQAAYRLARAAQRRLGAPLFEYTVWGAALKPHTPVTPVTSGFRLALERERKRKRHAVAAHESQTTDLIADDPSGFRLSAADLARFAGPFEAFMACSE